MHRGVAQAIHGAGESLRGNTLDAVDAATGDRTADAGHAHTTGIPKGAQNASVEVSGRSEMAEGLQRMAEPVSHHGTNSTSA
jgi:hypothetical protein